MIPWDRHKGACDSILDAIGQCGEVLVHVPTRQPRELPEEFHAAVEKLETS